MYKSLSYALKNNFFSYISNDEILPLKRIQLISWQPLQAINNKIDDLVKNFNNLIIYIHVYNTYTLIN